MGDNCKQEKRKGGNIRATGIVGWPWHHLDNGDSGILKLRADKWTRKEVNQLTSNDMADEAWTILLNCAEWLNQ